jgi:hypothetical protein
MGLKQLGNWVKSNIKPIAAVAAIVYPPLIPLIGTSLGATGAAATVVGAAALSGAASAVAGDKPADILKNAALGGVVAGVTQAVSGSRLFGGGADSGVIPAGTSAGGTAPVEFSASQAAELSGQVASQGLLGGVVQKVADFTGLTPDTIGKLGSAGVQSLLSSAGANQTAQQAQQAAQTQADAQIRAAQIAADAARFRPVGVTTRYGQSAFTTDAQGNVTGAGYSASPEITGYQDRLRTLASQGLTQAEQAPTAYAPLTRGAQSLFSLGQQYLSKSPEQAAQEYITKQQALLAPTQENQLALLQNKLFQQGRTGAATAQGGNLMNTNPEMAAYYNSIAQSNLNLAANADQAGKSNITFGGGLLGTGANLQNSYFSGQTAAYAPFATAMDTSTGLESLAQQPMTLGTQIGGRVTASAADAGKLLSGGITGAAQTMYPSNAFSASGNVLSGLSNSPIVASGLNSLFGVQQQPKQNTYTFNPTTGQYVPVQQSVWG